MKKILSEKMGIDPQSHLRGEQITFGVVLFVLLLVGFIFIAQHWNEFQTEVKIPEDTSAVTRIFVQHYLMLGVLRAGSVLGLLLLLLAIAILLFKFHLATEFKTKIFEISTKSKEIQEIASNQNQVIDELKNKIEELKLENFVKDILKSTRKE